ncbi:hypothetical protein [Tateyamaria sp.]|uniref:hypothetical protein n=1 Tax=Tateyamaria sp. TaxID=1929288 RepID=UPI003B226EB5
MPRLTPALSLIAIAALAGCAEFPQRPDAATRLDTSPLVFQNRAQDAAYLTEQADTLKQMAQYVQRKSTLRGAAAGAVIGCGLGVLTANGAERCLIGAAAGGLVGAAAGNKAGQRDVTRRLDAATPDMLMRSLRTTQDHMDRMNLSLPQVLAQQDAELAQLQTAHEKGEINQAAYDDGINSIRQSRADIAEALTMSEKQVRASRANIQNAVDKGQTGLDWHLKATQALQDDVYSARSGITLL